MTDTLPLSIQPVISYPKEAEVGKTYLMEIDLQMPESGFEWQYEEEEYLIYCMVNAGNLFTVTSVGEPAIVLHRFGGTYGNAKFLLEADIEERDGSLLVVFANHWGTPIRSVNFAVTLQKRNISPTLPVISSINRSLSPQYKELIKLALENDSISLDLSSQKLKTFPDEIFNLPNLQDLNLSGNQITQIPEAIANLTNLITLDLSDNQIVQIPDSISILANLTSLHLSNNKITAIPEAIANLTNLITLNLSDNQIVQIPDSISILANLTSLHLSNNKITAIPEAIANLTNLITLNLSDNQIVQIPDALKRLSNLRDFELYGNPLSFDVTIPNDYDDLTTSIISSNIELSKFYGACNPSRTLDPNSKEDRQYYVDLSDLQGAKLIERLAKTIVWSYPNESTCQLFTGHIGCGKSTELLRLKYVLERQRFHVAYCECTDQLDISDVDASDILLAIAAQLSNSLEKEGINIVPEYFKILFSELKDILHINLDLSASFKLSVGIAEITAQAKNSPSLRRQMRERLGYRTNSIINSINKELVAPAKEKLKSKGMNGLVVIVDNLDRVEDCIDIKIKVQSMVRYLFVECSDQLRGLDCHVIYTVPLLLTFSNDAEIVMSRFGTDIKILPMVPVRLQDGSQCDAGMTLLRQIVMATAFPKFNSVQRIKSEFVNKVFDSPQTLDLLCQASGGKVRNLLRLLFDCLTEDDPPFTAKLVESIITKYRNDFVKIITIDEWELIAKVKQDKRVRGNKEYRTLIRSQFVFEYEYQNENWFDVNPLLDECQYLAYQRK